MTEPSAVAVAVGAAAAAAAAVAVAALPRRAVETMGDEEPTTMRSLLTAGAARAAGAVVAAVTAFCSAGRGLATPVEAAIAPRAWAPRVAPTFLVATAPASAPAPASSAWPRSGVSNTNCRDDDKAEAPGASAIIGSVAAVAAVAATLMAGGRPRPRGTLRTGTVVMAGENVSLTNAIINENIIMPTQKTTRE
jgi:hypothetical protein